MNNLILVKHSLPEIIPSLPANQWSLSEAGRARCKPLTERVQLYAPDIVISSLEPKAVQTGQILASEINKPFHSVEGLHEHDRTGQEYLSKEQFEARVFEFFKRPNMLVMGRETAAQAGERFSRALASVEMDHPNRNVLVVSHGTVITLFVEKVTGLDPFPVWKSLDLPSFVAFSLPGHTLVKIVNSVV
jgi:broad specificity phosphatase PhoE